MVHPSPPLSPTESFNNFLGVQIHFPNVLVITVTIKLQIREMLVINICYATCKTLWRSAIFSKVTRYRHRSRQLLTKIIFLAPEKKKETGRFYMKSSIPNILMWISNFRISKLPPFILLLTLPKLESLSTPRSESINVVICLWY